MKVKLSSKKNKLLVLITFFVILAGAGGYLLWRVNQPETLSPEEGMAAPPEGVEGGETIPFPCEGILINLPPARPEDEEMKFWGQFVCGENCMVGVDPDTGEPRADICPPSRTFPINGDYLEGIYSISAVVGRGEAGQTQDKEDFQLSINNLPNDEPVPVTGGSTDYKEEIEEVGKFHIMEGENLVTMGHLHSCPPEDSPNSVHLYKLCLKEVNICEPGNWKEDPKGTHDYGTLGHQIVAEVSDADGLGEAEVTLNGSNLPKCETELEGGLTQSLVGVSCCYTEKIASAPDEIVILLDPGQQNIASGTYNLEVSWEDGKGIGGSNCELSTTFTVKEEIKNPDWNITKTPVETCINENTENPTAKLEYVITIENKGEGTGQIVSIVDTLDSKVQENYIDNIGSGGEFSNGVITWTLTGTEGDFAPGQSKTYAYSYIVPKDAFGLYQNTVEATPAEGNTLIANASITGNCLVLDPEPDPVCDGGAWNTGGKPSGLYPYCSEIDLSFDAWDSDGVDKDSIVVEVNGDARTGITKTTVEAGDTRVSVEDILSTETNCLEPGVYNIAAEWADTDGATGSQCTLASTFTVLEELKNPDWDIAKIPVETCINENTENPTAKLEYVITIENKGEGRGQIISIVDTLDSKVQEDYIENIGSGGEFSNGEITWTLSGTEGDFAPGESKVYSYAYMVPKNAFGLYENTVEATPVSGNTLIANTNITGDCLILEPEPKPGVPSEEDLPGTGIFDDVQKSLLAGFLLILLGFTWRFVGRGVFVSITLLGKIPKKISIHLKDMREERILERSRKRKQNFEKKVVKD